MADMCCKIMAAYYLSSEGHPCGKPAKVQREGKWYCGKHDPVKVAERQARVDTKYKAEVKDQEAFYAAKRLKDAKAEAFDEIVEALTNLLRVDDDWHGAVNSEMATAREDARAALARAREIKGAK